MNTRDSRTAHRLEHRRRVHVPGLKARPSAKHGREWIEESPLPCCPECRANQPFRLDCRHDNRGHGPYLPAII